MTDDLRHMAKQRRAFYEVLPYYICIGDKQGGPTCSYRRVQAGFDVDVYGAQIQGAFEPLSDDYAEAFAALKDIAETISHEAGGLCSLEVMQFPATVVLDTRNQLQGLGTLRMRISHCRGVEEAAGAAEHRALVEVANRLERLGLVRR